MGKSHAVFIGHKPSTPSIHPYKEEKKKKKRMEDGQIANKNHRVALLS